MCQEVEHRVPKPGSRGVCPKPCLCLLDIHIVRAALKHVPLQNLKPLQAHRCLSLLWVATKNFGYKKKKEKWTEEEVILSSITYDSVSRNVRHIF